MKYGWYTRTNNDDKSHSYNPTHTHTIHIYTNKLQFDLDINPEKNRKQWRQQPSTFQKSMEFMKKKTKPSLPNIRSEKIFQHQIQW